MRVVTSQARNGAEVAARRRGSFWHEPVIWWDVAVPATLGGAGFVTGASYFHWYLPAIGFAPWFLVEYIRHRLVLPRAYGLFAERHHGHHQDPGNLALLLTSWS